MASVRETLLYRLCDGDDNLYEVGATFSAMLRYRQRIGAGTVSVWGATGSMRRVRKRSRFGAAGEELGFLV